MRNFVFKFIILLFCISCPYALFSQNIKSNKSIASACSAPSASAELSINNVRTLIHNGGDMWWDLIGEPRYEVPKGSGKMSLFVGGIWIGGLDENDQLRSCFVLYRSGGVDYWPGPLITSGANQSTTTSDVCIKYDRHFSITKAEVEKFRTYINAKLESDTEVLNSDEFNSYVIPEIIEEWPAHGDVAAGYDYHMAPFYDADGNDIYNPDAGDYPYFDIDNELPCKTSRENRVSCLHGDKVLWWVFNDNGNIHMESNGTAIGLEIRAQAYAYATNDEINNMTFYNYELINRSTHTINNTYFGIYTDADLGDSWDDYVGCDVERGLGYIYNGDEMDGDGSGYTYGNQPPAIGIDFFEGPYQDADGEDNLSNWEPDTCNLNCSRAPIMEGSINGLNFEDGIVDNERWGMRKFMYFHGGGGDMGYPETAPEYYYYLKGYWRDGIPLTYGGDGYGGSIQADFVFPGSPNTDICGFGTAGNPQDAWSEETENTPIDDKRFVQSTGPFTLEPGAVNDITFGVVWARAINGGAWASVGELQRADDKAQKLFENCFQLLEGPEPPKLKIVELDKELIFHIYNNKGSNNYKNTVEDYMEKDPLIICPDDDNDGLSDNCDVYYSFEGYQVFQLKDKNCTVKDIYDTDKSKLVFQCDIENYDENGTPIDNLFNYDYNEDIQNTEIKLMVEGSNNGIKHSFRLTKDKFLSENNRFVNHKKYYYVAIAYAYNNYKKFDINDPFTYNGQKTQYKSSRKEILGNVTVYEAYPHKYKPIDQGTILNSTYGRSPQIVQLEGHGNGINQIDLTDETIERIMAGEPWETDSIVYRAGHGPINVKVVDPLNVPEKVLMLAIDSVTLIGVYRAKIMRGKWKLWEPADPSADTVYSNDWITYYDAGKRTSKNTEQLIADYGISITFNQVDFPLENKNTADKDGFIDATIEFEDNTKPWLGFVSDYDGCSPFDWIKSGSLVEQACGACNDYSSIYADVDQYYEKILYGTWAPYSLVAKDEYRIGVENDATGALISICSRKYGLAYNSKYNDSPNDGYSSFNDNGINPKYFQIQNVDLVITSDKSKWTRSPVIEMCEYDTTGGFAASGLAENNTLKFSLRNSPSVDKNGNPDGEIDESGTPIIGMGWFPGYAININTGKRLNIMFGEDSRFISDNGRDLIWNPSSRILTDLYIPGDYGGVAAGDIVWGGKHVIYIMGNNDSGTSNDYMPAYDEGKEIYDKLIKADPVDPLDLNKKRVYQNVMWVSIPVLNQDYELLETDVTVKLRVASPYQQGKYVADVENPRNENNPLYRFDLSDLAPTKGDFKTAKSALDLIGIVPNPFYGNSEYQNNWSDKIAKFINLPQNCTVSIYTISGILIRRFEKDDELSYIDWDLKNQYGNKIAGGVYIIYINAPEIGEKVLKWFGAMKTSNSESIY